MAVTLNASTSTGLVQSADTSGIITLQNNGTNAVTVDNGNLQFNSGYGSVATAYGCRAWVNFNGTGTVAIRGSGNVTSITDGGTGVFTVNFTTAMPDVNYAISGIAGETSGTEVIEVTSRATSSVSIAAYATETGGNKDSTLVCVIIFR